MIRIPVTERKTTMAEWIKHNFSIGNLLTLLLIFSAIIATAVRTEQNDKYHERVLMDHEQRIRLHTENRDIHIDTRRDDLRWQDLMSRLAKIEAKLDALR